MFNINNEPGWYGSFTRDQAEGAIPNGSRIVKCNSEEGDAHVDGTPGIVLGSFMAAAADTSGLGNVICYFIEWAPKPRIAIGTLHFKIRMAE